MNIHNIRTGIFLDRGRCNKVTHEAVYVDAQPVRFVTTRTRTLDDLHIVRVKYLWFVLDLGVTEHAKCCLPSYDETGCLSLQIGEFNSSFDVI